MKNRSVWPANVQGFVTITIFKSVLTKTIVLYVYSYFALIRVSHIMICTLFACLGSPHPAEDCIFILKSNTYRLITVYLLLRVQL